MNMSQTQGVSSVVSGVKRFAKASKTGIPTRSRSRSTSVPKDTSSRGFSSISHVPITKSSSAMAAGGSSSHSNTNMRTGSRNLNYLAPLCARSHSTRSSYTYHIPPYEARGTVPPPSDPTALSATSEDLTPEQRQVLERTIRVDQAGELGANYIYYGTTVALKMLGHKESAPSTPASPSTPLTQSTTSHLTPAPSDPSLLNQVEEMWSTERHHLQCLNTLSAQHRVRPTLLWPVWKSMAFALGAATAVLGKESVMACTEAVETVIGEHYDDQIKALESILPAEATQTASPTPVPTNSTSLTSTLPTSSPPISSPHPSIPHLLSVLREFRDDELSHLDTAVQNGAQMAPAHALLSSVVAGGCRGAIWVSGRI